MLVFISIPPPTDLLLPKTLPTIPSPWPFCGSKSPFLYFSKTFLPRQDASYTLTNSKLSRTVPANALSIDLYLQP